MSKSCIFIFNNLYYIFNFPQVLIFFNVKNASPPLFENQFFKSCAH